MKIVNQVQFLARTILDTHTLQLGMNQLLLPVIGKIVDWTLGLVASQSRRYNFGLRLIWSKQYHLIKSTCDLNFLLTKLLRILE